jgi:tetratricopeptide (TPR) repeat protein
VAANKFKRGLKKGGNRMTEAISEVDEPGGNVDFSLSLQQAEDGMLRELYKETRMYWKLDRAGVLEEINSNFKTNVKKSAALFEFVDFDYSNEEEEERESIMQERYVRCFVSAPYSDMQSERRLLAQEVFPAIRQRCMEIGVHFMECDFGWGVSENIAERKSTIMERMLEMRQNIKTYIIGLVAERYGYTYLLNSMPGHLAQDPMYVGKRAAVLGLQEIELDEGPLSRDIPHTAFYYTRDSNYLDTMEDPMIRSALQSEGLLARERLSHLKAKLRLSNVPIRENYKDPQEFATLALSDLTTKIVEDFPHDTTQEMLMHVDKQLMHEFEESTLKVFEGREEEMASLDDRVLSVQTITKPTIVVGEEGAGKSAFLVAWSRRFTKKHSYDFMFKQYAGLNTESGAWAGIVRGILQGMKDKFKLRKEIPNEVEHLPGAFSLWMGIMASLSARVIIMIDAVDRIHDIHVDPELESPPDDENDDDDHPLDRQPQIKPPHDLFWLPTIVPANIRIVVSVREGTPAHDQLVERKWGVFKLKPLDDESRQVLLKRFMKARGLDMPEGLQKKLLERGPSKKPLFLFTVMRSLQHPDDLKPTGALGTYLYARGMKELVHMVVDRLENTNGLQERCGLVEEVLSCVALSRRGLSESEIIGMMQVPRALFTKFYLQTRCLFQVFFGLMSFTSIEFYEEVRTRYLVHDEIVVMIRSRIATFFSFRPLTTRTVEEVPWQYSQGRRWTELTLILTRPEVFMILTNTAEGMFDLTLYWALLTKDSHHGGGGVNVVDKMEDCVRQSRESQFPVYEQIALLISAGDMLQRLAFYDIAMTYYRRARDLEDKEIGLSAISKIEYMLKETRIFLRKGDFQATRRMYDRTIKALTDLVDADGDGHITYEELKATDAGTLLLDTEEELMFMLYEGQYYSALEEMCLHMLGRVEDRPTNELLLFDVLINTYMETGKLDSAHDFIVRSLKAINQSESDEYVHVLARKLGLCLLRGNFVQAIDAVEESGWIWEAIDGGDEENLDDLIDILAFYCVALTQSGRAEDAVGMLMVAVNKQYPPEDEKEEDSSRSLLLFFLIFFAASCCFLWLFLMPQRFAFVISPRTQLKVLSWAALRRARSSARSAMSTQRGNGTRVLLVSML